VLVEAVNPLVELRAEAHLGPAQGHVDQPADEYAHGELLDALPVVEIDPAEEVGDAPEDDFGQRSG
jgi:hypothetical protein